MRVLRVFLVLALLSLLVLVSSLSAHDWSQVTARVERSLVRITHTVADQKGAYVCAGFVINRVKGYVLTAYHCLLAEEGGKANPYFQVDGLPSYIIQEWPDDDFVVVNLLPAGKPSLDYRRKPIRKGLPVAALGHAYGLETSTLLVGAVASPEASWGENGLWLTVDRHSIGGMSGGPVFDEEGRVVGVTQQTDDRTYISRPLSVILELSKRYWD